MKKFFIIIGVLVLVWGVCYVWQNFKWPGESDGTNVHYTISLAWEGSPEAFQSVDFPIGGQVEYVRISPPDEIGLPRLEIKTTVGWFESPRSSVIAPIDWKRGITVTFEYPEGKTLRDRTASKISIDVSYLLGIWQMPNGVFGCPPIPGDVDGVTVKEDGGVEVTVRSTYGLLHTAYLGGSAASDGYVEVRLSSEKIE